MPLHQNTYRKLDQDTAFNKVDPTSYYDCRNFRITSNDSSKNGALTVVKGNYPLPGSFSTIGYPNDKIIGSVSVRYHEILFTTNDDSAAPTASYGRLWLAPLYNDAVQMSDLKLLYSGLLNFSQQHPIEDAISFYESEEIQKIYWTDNYNNLRYANVGKYLTNSGAVYNASTNPYIDPDEFNIVQKMDLSTPTFTSIGVGSIPVGMVQYTYRLYKLNGPSSNFAPLSNMIPLTASSLSLQYTTGFKGSDQLDESGALLSSGKSITLEITGIDTDYDRIDVVAIHYSDLNGTPKIYLVDTKPVASSITVVDEGLYTNGEYSLEEFSLINNGFKCQTIAAKNNILFASNIQQSEFDFEFDSRAYRYNSGRSCSLYNVAGDYWYNSLSNGNTWTHFSSVGVAIESVASAALLPQDIDAICRSNDLSWDRQNGIYVYKQDGSTVGGEGPNVSYTFSINTDLSPYNRIDYFGSTVHDTFGGTSVQKPYYYETMEGPRANQELRTFTRDEIYRIGMIGIDDKGRNSPVKWIGDIRMPSNLTSISSTQMFCGGGSGSMSARPIMITFAINNLPSEVKYVQMVYVKRSDANRTIKFQGIINQASTISGQTYIRRPSESTTAIYATESPSSPSYVNRHIAMFSPEISFYKNFTQSTGDFIEVIATMLGQQENPTANFESMKYYTPTACDQKYANVSSAKIRKASINPDDPITPEAFGTISSSYPFYPRLSYTSGSLYQGNLGTCVLINLSSAISVAGISGSNYMLANYRTNLYKVQYGGASYEDRSRNEYIIAGKVATVSTGSATAYAKYGDTFINYADHLVGFYNESAGNKFAAVAMFPVETTVNLAYRLDDCYHRIYKTIPASYWIREVGNAEFTANGTTHSYGWTDLYLENTVYKRVSDVKKYYAAPIDYEPEYISDTLVMASNAKEGGETIDPWTVWASNESISVDKNYGPVQKLLAWRNYLLYFQRDAVGALSVLDRSLVSDQGGRDITLGEGSILQRYDNIATNIGLSTRFSIAQSLNGVYWYDHKRRGIHRFLNGVEDLSTIRGVNSYLNNLKDDYAFYNNVISPTLLARGFFMSYNPMYKEIWLTIKENAEFGTSLVYNEVMDAFTGFVDTKGYFFIDYDNKVFSAYSSYMYREDKGYPGQYFGQYYDSYVTAVVNPIPNMTTTLTNLEITSEVYETVLDPLTPWNIPWNTVDETAGPGTDPPIPLYKPSLNTYEAVFKGTYATSGGANINDGGAEVTEKGVVYSQSPNPTYESSSKTSDGSGTANFTSTLVGLTANSQYYVRAYAKNSVGIGYGLEDSFYTIETLKVTTRYISDITYNTAYCNFSWTTYNSDYYIGNITYGSCWSTSPNPTIADAHSSATEEFYAISINRKTAILGLTPGTTYYVRAYATNDKGIAYGEQLTFTTVSAEVGDVITTDISSIATTSAVSGGNVTDDHGVPVTARGVCWSTSIHPTLVDSYTVNGSGLGSFTSNIINLTEGTIYFVRAYAINAAGTSYGNEVSFTTLKTVTTGDLVDIDGNIYTTVYIGNQEWMVQNLKVSKYSDGVSINYLTDGSAFNADSVGAFCYYNNNISNKNSIGALYNWYAVNNARGLCYFKRNGVQETGWRIATNADWGTLRSFLGTNLTAGGPLKDTGSTYWNSGNIGATNSSGFTGRGSGQRLGGYFSNWGYQGNFWTSSSHSTTEAWFYQLLSAGPVLYSFDTGKKHSGYAVRCVRDYTPPVDPEAPEIPVVSAATSVGYDRFTANWLTALRATKYYLDVASDAGFSSILSGYNNLDVGSSLSWLIQGLQLNSTYYYRLRSYDGSLTSASSSPIGSATTLNLVAPPAPVANPATSITSSSFSANWDASPGATKYYLDVSTNSSFSSFVTGYNNLDVGNVITYPVTSLSPGFIYYYRVRAYSWGGTSVSSNVRAVTIAAQPAPLLSLNPSSINFYLPGIFNSKVLEIHTANCASWDLLWPSTPNGTIHRVNGSYDVINVNGISFMELYYEGEYQSGESIIVRALGIDGSTKEVTFQGYWI